MQGLLQLNFFESIKVGHNKCKMVKNLRINTVNKFTGKLFKLFKSKPVGVNAVELRYEMRISGFGRGPIVQGRWRYPIKRQGHF